MRMRDDDLFPIYIWPHPGAPPLDQNPTNAPVSPPLAPEEGEGGT